MYTRNYKMNVAKGKEAQKEENKVHKRLNGMKTF